MASNKWVKTYQCKTPTRGRFGLICLLEPRGKKV